LVPLIVIFVGLFMCRLIPAVSMVTWWDVTVEMVWCALIADWTVKAGMLVVRYRKGKWKELEV
jgi:Na+-driven multidrug efflux pump